MNAIERSSIEFSQLIPAIQAGAYDALNPCALATMLIFIAVLSHFARRPMSMFFYGGAFVLSSMAAQLLLAIGTFDYYFLNKLAEIVIMYIYFVLAIGFIALGIFHAIDWFKHKKYNDIACFKIELPSFFSDQSADYSKGKVTQIFSIILNGLIVIFIAFTLTVIGNIYPQSEYIFIVHSFMLSGGDPAFVRWAFGLYIAFISIFTVAAWLSLWIISLYRHKREALLPAYKAILSAALISTSIGLFYFLGNNLIVQ